MLPSLAQLRVGGALRGGDAGGAPGGGAGGGGAGGGGAPGGSGGPSGLFDHLAARQVGKDPLCEFHDDDDQSERNCAIEGYLMSKPVTPRADALSQPASLTVETDEGPRKMLRLEGSSKAARLRQLTNARGDFFPDGFDGLCVRGNAQVKNKDGSLKTTKDGAPVMSDYGVTWREFQSDLQKYTDYYFLDEWADSSDRVGGRRATAEQLARREELEKRPRRGLLFVGEYTSREKKEEHGLPTDGVFAEPFLFVVLVCARGTPGFGSLLMQMAEDAAAQLGCSRVTLAALPNAAPFYYGKGYRFASRAGEPVSAAEWEAVEGGKVRLYPEPRTEVRKRPGAVSIKDPKRMRLASRYSGFF